ncbi:MAG: phosphoribosylglycinamide formyltransferase [Elusimicrobia bacterium RIFCSPLOWO2_02_FULL_39_32]|nr:MAG: phosphoribosylglycinamide formyltransferase [Elusimicrobia bacterium GWA2_38_7]OGR80583.1 MAG: phosphoribosylglycinamide formyltransferase [Elusimicrobia bacterium RIFCSPHIGHO2_02_FULL_39_36]OGR91265.1 MAG: phosphoribosylglycinamide formyltransferase [Elusimicrobia bacterium RIFCSPLOWO2_02_FULL_39_32]OGS00639.1 MAG: phosphoribosylglycinamide formyltransferase [Elusimicrobia bacterium RIFCSPLOWO2_12_FULL_39_28]
MKVKIAVLASGNGSNLQAIIDATSSEVLKLAEVVLVIANKKEAFALERAKRAGIEALFLDPLSFSTRFSYFEKITDELENRKVDLVCLAGFLLKLEGPILKRFSKRLLNIHPALLPKFGGKGMYGHHVHEAVLKAGEKESGCSVHVVDQDFDHGPILLQRKVLVLPEDTPQTLADRILKEEHLLYPEAIHLYIQKYLK